MNIWLFLFIHKIPTYPFPNPSISKKFSPTLYHLSFITFVFDKFVFDKFVLIKYVKIHHIMVYECLRCHYTTNVKCNYYRHITRKKPCKLLNNTKDGNNESVNVEDNNVIIEPKYKH